ncbi:MAG: hypothetical protein L0Y72_26445 [Gemmataceae bacterium]|nr:hypothetical protein [Gemmataceae bacterium]
MSQAEPRKGGPFEWLKETIEAVGVVYSAVDVLVSGAGATALAYFVESPTLRWFVVIGAIVGAIIGYFRTALYWKDVAREKRRKRSTFYFILSFFLLLVFIGTLALIGTGLAQTFEVVASIRELIIAEAAVLNGLFLVECLVLLFCLVTAITLLSPNLDRKTSTNK